MNIRISTILGVFAVLCSLGTSANATPQKNLFPNGNFNHFDGNLPRGWSVNSWNQAYMKESYGSVIDQDPNFGTCFRSNPGNPMAVISFTAPDIQLTNAKSYVLKFFYKSTLTNILELELQTKDSSGATQKEKALIPSTQGHWTEFFREFQVEKPNVKLTVKLTKKWSTGYFQLDTMSLRAGKLSDFGDEFRFTPPKGLRHIYPIFSFLGPDLWKHYGKDSHKYDTDNVHAEYARCNFSKGYTDRFGIHMQSRIPADEHQLQTLGKKDSLWIFHDRDEPGANVFQELRKNRDRVHALAPGKPYWCNLLPVYGFSGFPDYQNYLETYINTVKPDFLTYDFYSLGGNYPAFNDKIFANLEMVRAICQKHSLPWGAIHLVVQHMGLRSPEEQELRWQAFTSLAYGSQAIGWFTYLTEIEYGNIHWNDAVIDRNANRTRHYAMLQRLNREILCLGNTLLQLTSTGVWHSLPLPYGTHPIPETTCVKLTTNDPLILGEFKHRKDGTPYFMIANRSFVQPAKAEIIIPQGKMLWEVSPKDGILKSVPAPQNACTIELQAGDGRLFCLK